MSIAIIKLSLDDDRLEISIFTMIKKKDRNHKNFYKIRKYV